MTEKQYESFMNSNLKLYKIWLRGTVIKKKIVKKDKPPVNWINSKNIYDCSSHRSCRYVTEDKLNDQILKFLKQLYDDYETEIKDLTRKQIKVSAAFNIYS